MSWATCLHRTFADLGHRIHGRLCTCTERARTGGLGSSTADPMQHKEVWAKSCSSQICKQGTGVCDGKREEEGRVHNWGERKNKVREGYGDGGREGKLISTTLNPGSTRRWDWSSSATAPTGAVLASSAPAYKERRASPPGPPVPTGGPGRTGAAPLSSLPSAPTSHERPLAGGPS